jgi:hypothetical protein
MDSLQFEPARRIQDRSQSDEERTEYYLIPFIHSCKARSNLLGRWSLRSNIFDAIPMRRRNGTTIIAFVTSSCRMCSTKSMIHSVSPDYFIGLTIYANWTIAGNEETESCGASAPALCPPLFSRGHRFEWDALLAQVGPPQNGTCKGCHEV